LIVSLATLVIGIIIGYLGQRSGFCSTGSIRGFLITRDKRLLRDVVALTAVAFTGYFLLSLAGIAHGFPVFARPTGNIVSVYSACVNPYVAEGSITAEIVIFTIIGGLGVGLVSVIANGCPFRQHVRASEGDRGSLAFVLGFYLAGIAAGFFL